MARSGYTSSVFINCPFDDDYVELRNALVFTVYDCGFVPRCALEEDNSGNVRFEKIQRLISESKFGIHDISRSLRRIQESNSLNIERYWLRP